MACLAQSPGWSVFYVPYIHVCNTFHIMLILRVNELSGGGGQSELGDNGWQATDPQFKTAIQLLYLSNHRNFLFFLMPNEHSVLWLVRLTPLDIFKKNSRQFLTLFVATRTRCFLRRPWDIAFRVCLSGCFEPKRDFFLILTNWTLCMNPSRALAQRCHTTKLKKIKTKEVLGCKANICQVLNIQNWTFLTFFWRLGSGH